MLKESLAKLIRKEDLSEAEMVEATNFIMDGQASAAQIGSFLTALRVKGETVTEIAGAAKVMREKALKVKYEAPVVIDTCGTGGDGSNTFNISTTAAFIVAAAGIPVAKHGNRAMSSRCGSADLLEALGIKVDLSPERVEKCLKEAGIGFLFAPAFHSAMKHVVGPRRELGFRTIFNVLGPLTNPAGANCQLLGVYDASLTEVLAQVLKKLGAKRAMVVHGGGGLDELSLEGINEVSYLHDETIENFTFRAEDVGLEPASNELLRGETPSDNAQLTERILNGLEQGPPLAVVLLNAAAALMVAGVAPDFKDGIVMARQYVQDGRAYEKLQQLRKIAV
ncbi:MAG TPA: anthranilate phosphoribosyltransferase [Firmicutes bacterium]|jgi:anthranilate phosphoribosyltransferase|nr:anthranilate phosphoribosyltransferase [Bacillota bacterium]